MFFLRQAQTNTAPNHPSIDTAAAPPAKLRSFPPPAARETPPANSSPAPNQKRAPHTARHKAGPHDTQVHPSPRSAPATLPVIFPAVPLRLFLSCPPTPLSHFALY